jgi:23S rRNA (cytidine2498-2'-O)-methyltransferase
VEKRPETALSVSAGAYSDSLLLYCRAGFEAECAQEIVTLAGTGHADAPAGAGFVDFAPDPNNRRDPPDWRALIFARQCIPVFAKLTQLPRQDRLTPIMQALALRNETFSDAWVEAPDNDTGKALAPFCKSFGNALIGGLKKARMLDLAAPRRLHAFFPQSDNVYLGAVHPAHAAPWPQGIPRLKFPREAPSRSTLKLDEALLVLLDDGERARWLKPGMSAVDLGAAPGGWTWQLVRRSLRVTAIDNGPMDPALMASGLVTHLRTDGFRYRPKKPVDWLVCDMVEQPRRVAELIANWFADAACRHAVFNLKLPMKKRFDEARLCLERVRGAARDVRARQLYHDREEITVFARAG